MLLVLILKHGDFHYSRHCNLTNTPLCGRIAIAVRET
jgi:hypothetical protein